MSMSNDAERLRRERIAATLKGRPKSAETRQRMSEAAKRRSQQHLQRMSDVNAGKRAGQAADGSYIRDGYRVLTGLQGHPLAHRARGFRGRGEVLEHRKVLYDAIGPGPHLCHWGCGKTLEWGGLTGIIVDHLDDNKLNNSAENLVPSCNHCNMYRGKTK